MAISKDDLKNKGLDSFKTEKGKEILNLIFNGKETQEEIKLSLINNFNNKHKRNHLKSSKSVNSLVSNYLNAWKELDYLCIKRDKNLHAKDKYHKTTLYYSLNFGKIIIEFIKIEYKIDEETIKKAIVDGWKSIFEFYLIKGDLLKKWINTPPEEFFNYFFKQNKVLEHIRSLYNPSNFPLQDCSFPEFLWGIIASISQDPFINDPEIFEEELNYLNAINRKIARSLTFFYNINRWYHSQRVWYSPGDDIPPLFHNLKFANEIMQQYHFVFSTLVEKLK